MHSPAEDRTARAIIRDEALRLFAARGSDAVTVREIATAAGVSPALVMRHYGSKDGLRDAVDKHVLRVFAQLLDAATSSTDAEPSEAQRLNGLAESIARQLPDGSPIPRYLARMLVTDDPSGARLFARLHALGRQTLDRLIAAGVADDGGDPAARSAFLLVNDLAVLLMRDRLADVLGVDPLSPTGLRRWGRQVLAVYGGGLTAAPPIST